MRMVTLEKQQMKCAGLRLSYLQGGEGKPIVFFHAIGLSSRSYLRSLELLAEHCRVYALDIPGFGGSEKPKKTWNYADFTLCAQEWLDSLGLKTAAAIGHSLGGGLAFHLAAKDARIKELVLVNAAGFGIPDSKLTLLWGLAGIGAEFISPEGWKYIPTLAADSLLNISAILHGIYGSARTCLSEDGSDLLDQITARTLILWGDRERYFPSEHVERFKTGIKNARLEMMDGGHAWCIIHPELFAERVLDFLI